MLNRKQNAVIAWLSIFSAGLGLLFLLITLFTQSVHWNGGLLFVFALNIIGIYSGVGVLKGKLFPKKLLAIYWVVQIVSARTEDFFFSFVSGIHFNFTYATSSAAIQFNIFATIMFLFALRLISEHVKLVEATSDQN